MVLHVRPRTYWLLPLAAVVGNCADSATLASSMSIHVDRACSQRGYATGEVNVNLEGCRA